MEVALAGGVTRLTLPDYVSPSEEPVTLHARFPDQSFGLNFKYLSYRGAGEGGPPILPHGHVGAPSIPRRRCWREWPS
jgi:hypothetical protein